MKMINSLTDIKNEFVIIKKDEDDLHMNKAELESWNFFEQLYEEEIHELQLRSLTIDNSYSLDMCDISEVKTQAQAVYQIKYQELQITIEKHRFNFFFPRGRRAWRPLTGLIFELLVASTDSMLKLRTSKVVGFLEPTTADAE